MIAVVSCVAYRKVPFTWAPIAVDTWRVCVAWIALSVLIGWASGIDALVTWGGRSEMVPNTAICLAMLTLAALIRSRHRGDEGMRHVSHGLALCVIVVAGLVLSGLGPSMDSVIHAYQMRPGSSILQPGRMGPGTAGALVAMALGIVGTSRRPIRVTLGYVAVLLAALGTLHDGRTAIPTFVAIFLLSGASIMDRRYV